MARIGTAPRRLSPGVWKTRLGEKLTPAQAKVWENYYRTGRTDGKGHMTKQSVVQAPPRVYVSPQKAERAVPYKKPSFDTFVKADRGDSRARREVSRYAAHEQATEEARAQVDLMTAERFGIDPLSHAAHKTINPAAGAVLEALSPTTAALDALHAAKRGNLPTALLAGSGIMPIFPFGKARAARKALDAVKAEEKLSATKKAEEEVLKLTGAARRRYSEQKKLRKEELSKRVEQSGQAYEEAGGGRAGHRAALAELRGELPSLRFDRLTHLDEPSMEKLLNAVHSTELKWLEKLNLQAALLRVQEGRVPRPFEIKLIEKAFGPDAAAEFGKTRPLSRKVMRAAGEVANLPRSLLASFDVSAPFRQGLVATAHNPRLVLKNLGPMFRMLVSEKRYGQIMDEIVQRPSYDLMLDSRLQLTDLGDMTTREEQFMSNLAEKITGGKRGFVRASSRAYVGFLNRLRADMFDELVSTAQLNGIETPKIRRDIARFVNVATGRGELGPLEGAAVALNATLFSPRLFASRIQAFNPLFYASLDPFVRKQAVLATSKLVGAGSAVLGLAALAGAKVAVDPRNSDWGKIRIGNTRFDIWGGHQQLARLFAQVQQGEIVSSTTGKKLRLTGGGDLSRFDITLRFLQGKLAPTPSLIVDWFKNSDYAGKPFSWKKEVLARMWPLLLQDVTEVYRDTGSPWKAVGAYGIGAFGIGVQNYPSDRPGKKEIPADPFAGVDVGPSSDPFSNLFGGP